MKIKKVTIMLCAIVFSTILCAEKPTDKNKMTELAELMYNKLNADVQFTDSQKQVIKEKLNLFVKGQQAANAKRNINDIRSEKKKNHLQFKAALDSILNESQKKVIEIKKQEKIETSKNKKNK